MEINLSRLLIDNNIFIDPDKTYKILALHGGGDSANSMTNSLKNLKDTLGIKFDFVSVSLGDNANKGETWWVDEKPNTTYDRNHANNMVNKLNTIVEQQGPFWGILGFSQGAAAVPVYLSNRNDKPFEVAIMFCGYLTTTHQGLLDKVNEKAPFNGIRSLHWLSESDWFKTLSKELTSKFTDPIIINDPSAGHIVPNNKNTSFNNVVSWFRGHIVSTIYMDTYYLNQYSYSLITGTGSEDNNKFTISGSQLLINQNPNYSNQSSYNIRINATDQLGSSIEKAFILSVKESWNLDVDGDGQVTVFTDGFLILRKMFGSVFDGDALTNGLISSNATRRNSTEIHEYIQKALDDGILDIDGSGEPEPFTDGFLILRKMFGSVFDGDALTNGLISSNATRTNSADIHAYIDNLMPNT